MIEVDQSYRWCRDVCRRSKSTFFSSFAILDPPRRRAMYALYAFSRISDDLSDSEEPNQAGVQNQDLRRDALQAYRQQLLSRVGRSSERENGQASQKFSHEHRDLWPALNDAVTRFSIPVDLLVDIVDGVMMDLKPRIPNDMEELEDYCYHVASAVGLACAHIWLRDGHELPEKAARICGYAFQLTNILRDVAEDAQMGRVYVPRSMLEAYQIELGQWMNGRPNGDWRGLIDELGQQALHYYDLGWRTIDALTPRSQRMFSLIWRCYRALLEEVLRHKEELWEPGRIRIPRRQKIGLVAQHYLPPLYQRLPAPCPN